MTEDKILLIDKPEGWTSFDVVAKIRNNIRSRYRVAKEEQIPGRTPGMTTDIIGSQKSTIENLSSKKIKVGHAGTLDPFATGLLIVLVGKATKKQDEFMKKGKEYEATLKLGYTSTTGDPEGEISKFSVSNFQFSDASTPRCHPQKPLFQKGDVGDLDCHVVPPLYDELENVLKRFTGEIEQTPHAFSAIKIEGKRAYELARAGKEVNIKPRRVNIHSLKIENYEYPFLKIRVSCSSGTYIRVLAEDIGKALGCSAYLTELRRTKIDDFDVKDALSVEEALKTLNKSE